MAEGVTGSSTTDTVVPASGQFFYLPDLAHHGSLRRVHLGEDSSGSDRPNLLSLPESRSGHDADTVLDVVRQLPDGEQRHSGGRDGDGHGDACDNCPLVANADQRTPTPDASGDACDPDNDNDGVPNGSDNCPFLANPSQLDVDLDNVGDCCDPDFGGACTP
jgi:hypothetical protein